MIARAVRGLRAFGAFWWDFVMGDDWRVGVGVVVALACTALLAHHDAPGAWVLLPLAVAALLGWSLARAVRAARRG